MRISYNNLIGTDYTAVVRLINNLEDEEYRTFDYRLGAFDADKLIGALLAKLCPDKTRVQVKYLYAPNGDSDAKLLSMLEEKCAKNGVKRIEVLCDSQDWSALALYIRNGFVETKRLFQKEV